MVNQDIKSSIVHILAEISGVSVEKFKDPDSPLTSLGFDSLKIVKVVLILEKQFDIEFDQSQLNSENFRSVGTLTNLIADFQS